MLHLLQGENLSAHKIRITSSKNISESPPRRIFDRSDGIVN